MSACFAALPSMYHQSSDVCLTTPYVHRSVGYLGAMVNNFHLDHLLGHRSSLAVAASLWDWPSRTRRRTQTSILYIVTRLNLYTQHNKRLR